MTWEVNIEELWDFSFMKIIAQKFYVVNEIPYWVNVRSWRFQTKETIWNDWLSFETSLVSLNDWLEQLSSAEGCCHTRYGRRSIEGLVTTLRTRWIAMTTTKKYIQLPKLCSKNHEEYYSFFVTHIIWKIILICNSHDKSELHQ